MASTGTDPLGYSLPVSLKQSSADTVINRGHDQ
jgi:hypothetical protein